MQVTMLRRAWPSVRTPAAIGARPGQGARLFCSGN